MASTISKLVIAAVMGASSALTAADALAQRSGTHAAAGTRGSSSRTASRTPTPRGSRLPPGIHAPTRPGDPEKLDLPLGMPGAYFYRPSGGGRQRVLVYLHSRGANPREACRRWHESTPRFGWLLCPIGQVDRGNGRREWHNNADYARRESIEALEFLGRSFPRRVRRHDNVVMGFSEGAFVGMNVGLMEPETFPRWLIVAAHDGYIDSEPQRIARAARVSPRVYLITGEHDEIVAHTRRAETLLQRAFGRRRVRMRILDGAGHELPPQFVPVTRRALLWLTQP